MSNDQNPMVSVVMPVYNAEQYLEETIESILSQTYSSIEIIAVDDGSTDNSVSVLKRYPSDIVIVNQKNSGPAVARNRGVQESKGEFIAFIDSDDLWYPTKIDTQVSLIGKEGWCHTDSSFIGGVNSGLKASDFTEKLGGDVLERLVQTNFIGTSTVLINKKFFLSSGGFDPTLSLIEDWDFWVRLAAKKSVVYVDDTLVDYRVHPSSVSRGTRKTLPYHIKVIESFFKAGGPAEHLSHLETNTKANSYSICSHIAEEERDFSFALQCSYKAWLCQPFSTFRYIRLVKSFIKSVIYWKQ